MPLKAWKNQENQSLKIQYNVCYSHHQQLNQVIFMCVVCAFIFSPDDATVTTYQHMMIVKGKKDTTGGRI